MTEMGLSVETRIRANFSVFLVLCFCDFSAIAYHAGMLYRRHFLRFVHCTKKVLSRNGERDFCAVANTTMSPVASNQVVFHDDVSLLCCIYIILEMR